MFNVRNKTYDRLLLRLARGTSSSWGAMGVNRKKCCGKRANL
jgi:hypothetical protein